jgi:hypothetical protein
LDNSYSVNYNISTDTYQTSRETTFDRIIRPGTVLGSADYGITGLAFNQINNCSVSNINALGGLDGITNFSSGDTLIFLQQENFGSAVGEYDGWVDANGSVVPGWLQFNEPIPTSTPTNPQIGQVTIINGVYNVYTATAGWETANFPANPQIGQVTMTYGVYFVYTATYNKLGLVTSMAWNIANLRGNVWTINIDSNDIVTLTPTTFYRTIPIVDDITIWSGTEANDNPSSRTSTTTITPDDVLVESIVIVGDYVQTNFGSNYSESILLYNPILPTGQSEPGFTLTNTLLAPSTESTIFDGNGTKFITNAISYEFPGVGDTWLKFYNTGPLQ